MNTGDFPLKATLLAVASLTVMSSATIAASLPQMAEVFRATPNAEFLTKLILTTPSLFIAFFAPLAGAFIDRFGRMRFLYGNLVLYGFAGASGYALDDLHQILAGRALLGVAVAGTMTTCTTLAGDYFAGEARIRYSGMQSMFMSLGAVLFIGAGGLLADIGWRLPFLLYLSAWVVLIPALIHLPEPARHARTGASAAQGGPVPLGALVLACLLAFFMMMMFYMTPVQLPFLLREIGVPSATLAGAAIVASALAGAAGSATYPMLKRRTGFVRLYAWSMLFVAAGYGAIALASGYGTVLAGATISGFGAGLIFPNNNLWVITLAPARLRGRLTGILTACLCLGQFSSPVFVEPAVRSVGLLGAFGVFAGIAALIPALLLLAGRETGSTGRSTT